MYSITETVDGKWMILFGGFQWGEHHDSSGAGSAVWETEEEARQAAQSLSPEEEEDT